MNSAIHQLIGQQCNDWTQCGENYSALTTVEIQNFEVNGFNFKVQFNPKRIQSSAAKVDSKSILERKCFLCEQNRPSEQIGIPFTSKKGNSYSILVNPFPIFRQHLTIPSTSHQDQRIKGKIEDMLELASIADDFLFFYNGPKCGASAPDHFHFQAGNKGFLPMEVNIEKILASAATQLDAIAYSLDSYPAKAVILKSADSNEISEWFRQFYLKFEAVSDDKEEPMMNLLAWKTDDLYYLVIYPRKAHRPKQFFAEDEDNLLISPASIDFGGAFITPLEKDFRKITSNDIADILQQVTISEETFNALIHE